LFVVVNSYIRLRVISKNKKKPENMVVQNFKSKHKFDGSLVMGG